MRATAGVLSLLVFAGLVPEPQEPRPATRPSETRPATQPATDQRLRDLEALVRTLEADSGARLARTEENATLLRTEIETLRTAATRAAEEARSRSFPIGTIVAVLSDPVAIPDGWALCDGTAGTPDLEDGRFLMGVGARDIGIYGGSATIPEDGGYPGGETGGRIDREDESWELRPRDIENAPYRPNPHWVRVGHVHPVPGVPPHDHGGDNRPPFLGVRFIMRVR